MRFVLLFITASLILTANPSGAAELPSWMGVTLEEPISAVRERLGDPLRSLVSTPGGPSIDRYLARNGRAFLFISHRNNRVIGIGIQEPINIGELLFTSPPTGALTDPSGVSVGMSVAQVRALRGAGGHEETLEGEVGMHYGEQNVPHWNYYFNGDRLTRIDLNDGAEVFLGTRALAPADRPPLHDGLSLERAIVIVAPSDELGTRFIRLFRVLHPCSPEVPMREVRQGLLDQGSRHYDTITVQCGASGPSATLYFDITATFGKM